jgi:GNAT superfamily N-acetyltransferase
MAELDAMVVRTEVYEAAEADRRFADARGFVEVCREQESVLDLLEFDAEQFAADVARVLEQGIEILAYPELAERDPESEGRWYDMDREIAADVPDPDDYTPLSFEVWHKRKFENPRFLPDCNLIAVDGERYVGLSNLWQDEMEGRLMTGLTGVRRAYRKRGIATALKVRALAAAKAAGYASTITWNDSQNQGMLGINLRLGFRLQPAWLRVEKVLDAEALAREKAGGDERARATG